MLCFRLFSENNPAAPLAEAVAQLREGQAPKDLYAVEPASFQQISNAPFAYWVSERIRRLFVELPAFEGEGRTVRQGLATANDFRFVRTAWEPPAEGKRAEKKWFPFAKGGSYSPYYADLYLKVNWGGDGAECKEYIIHRYPYLNGNAGFVAKNTEYYFKPGITWPLRTTSGLSMRILPNGSVFGHKGPAAFDESSSEGTLTVLGICQSSAFQALLSLQLAAADAAARSYEVGILQRTVLPKMKPTSTGGLRSLSHSAWSTKRKNDTAVLSSSAFLVPALAPHRLAV